MAKHKFKVLGYIDYEYVQFCGFAIQNSMGDVLKAAEDAKVTVKNIIDMGCVPEDVESSFEYEHIQEDAVADAESGESTQLSEFDTFLALCLKFNPQLCTDDICDTVCCENCPYDCLTPEDSESVDECMTALAERLDQFRKEI